MTTESILGGAQTYIGVLATLIVLCLFASKESNFIFYTIVFVGNDFKMHLQAYVEKIKKEIQDNYSNKNIDINSIPDADLKSKINASTLQLNMLTQAFFNKAQPIANRFDPLKHIEKREELTYIALISLLLAITTMFIDCLGFIPIGIRACFIATLLTISTLFTFVLYHKFLWEEGNNSGKNENERFKKPLRLKIFLNITTIFLGGSFILPFICSPIITIIIFILILATGIFAVKYKWIQLCHKYNRYNRFWVFKHFVCFIFFSLIVTLLVTFGSHMFSCISYNQQCINNWELFVSIMETPTYAYYIILIFFTINGIFGPIITGFILLQTKENDAIRCLQDLIEEIKPLITKYSEEHAICVSNIKFPHTVPTSHVDNSK